jgi:hypothetical protein
MTASLLGLLLIGALVWLWMGALAWREFAILTGQRLCREAGVQLLDQSVALERLRMWRTSGGFAIERRYHFDVSVDGTDRGRGHIDLTGRQLRAWSVPMRVAQPDAESQACGKVTPRWPMYLPPRSL